MDPPFEVQISDVLNLAPDQQLSALLRRCGGDIHEVVTALQRRCCRRAGLYPEDETQFWKETRSWLRGISQDGAPEQLNRRDFHQMQRGLIGTLGWNATINILERMELIMYGMDPMTAWTSPTAELLLAAYAEQGAGTEHLN